MNTERNFYGDGCCDSGQIMAKTLDKIREWMRRESQGQGQRGAQADFIRKLPVKAPGQVTKFFAGKEVYAGALLDWMESLGFEVVFPGEKKDTAKQVHFVNPRVVSVDEMTDGPVDDQYIAVPLATMPVAAGAGMIPEESIRGWVLVWTGQAAVRHKSKLVAVEIGRSQDSMVPTLHPFDLVLVDRDDTNVTRDFPGNIFLVQEPAHADAGLSIKRVKLQRKNGRELVTFFSDNPQYPPDIYELSSDYGDDIRMAVKGRVVWSWSDMTKK
jgi:hypothetical protein